MRIVPAGPEHRAARAALRHSLWPEDTVAEPRAALDDVEVAFVAIDDADVVVGFVEANLRHDYVNGCETSPVAFVEGLFVDAPHRGQGMGRALIAAVADWARATGCGELASDAELDNVASHRFHAALGFAETERVVYFRRLLDGGA